MFSFAYWESNLFTGVGDYLKERIAENFTKEEKDNLFDILVELSETEDSYGCLEDQIGLNGFLANRLLALCIPFLNKTYYKKNIQTLQQYKEVASMERLQKKGKLKADTISIVTLAQEEEEVYLSRVIQMHFPNN
jgi:hypothetical protein